MSTETYADVEDIERDLEDPPDKKLNIRVPVKQHSGSSVGSRRSSASNISAFKLNLLEKRKIFGRQEKVEEKQKPAQVQFEAIKELTKQKVKTKGRTSKKKGVRPKSASSSRSRSRENKKIGKTKKNINGENRTKSKEDDSDDEPDVSEIVLIKQEVKNIAIEGVLPGSLKDLSDKRK